MVDKLNILNELLEETLRCAEESELTASLNGFTAFVEEMLPADILDVLYSEANASLEDIWNERYAPPPAPMQPDTDLDTDGSGEQYVEDGCCVLCEREMRLTRHHTIPREMHERVAKRLGVAKEILNQTIPVCRMCHNAIHRFYTNKELALEFYTLDLLLASDKIQKYAKWASGLAPGGTRN